MTKKFLALVLATIVLYRVVTYILIYFYGQTAWWHQIYTDPWNHYQLGVILLVASLFANRVRLIKRFRLPIVALGTGMIIDEVTDVIKLLHLYPLPPNFRDSFPDLVLIFVTYIVFAAIVLAWKKK